MTTTTQGEHAQTEALQYAELLESDSHIGTDEKISVAATLRDIYSQVAALTAAQEVPKCEFLAHGCDTPSYCQSVQRCTARDEKRAPPAQPAAPQGVAEVNWWEADGDKYDASISPMQPAQGVAYAELPKLFREALAWGMTYGPEIPTHQWEEMRESMVKQYTERASNGQAPAGAADEMAINRPVEDSALPFNQWRGEMQSALKRAGVYAARSPGAGNKLTLRWRATRDDVLPAPTAQAAPAAGAVAGPTSAHIAAMERAWLWMDNQADSQSKGGHATFDLLMLREERDALRATIDMEATATCPHCNGTGEVFGHSENCTDDLCALNGDVHSCAGQVEPCQCAAAPTPAAQADSVLEDAARMDWLAPRLCAYDVSAPMLNGGTGPAIMFTWPIGVDMKFADLRGSIDAARKQGGTHDNH